MTVEILPMGSGWRVKHNGRHHSKHRLKRRAVSEGQRLAKKTGSVLRVHKSNGRFHYTRNYSLTRGGV